MGTYGLEEDLAAAAAGENLIDLFLWRIRLDDLDLACHSSSHTVAMSFVNRLPAPDCPFERATQNLPVTTAGFVLVAATAARGAHSYTERRDTL